VNGARPRGRILWVTEEPPDRALGGGSIRQAHLFEALAGAVPTDLLLVGSLGDEGVRAAAAGVHELPKRPAVWSEQPLTRRALSLGIALASRYPSAIYPAAPSRRALARELATRAGRYELVCLEHEALAPLARARPATRTLITFHHVVSAMVAQELAHTGGGRRRWYRERDLAKARRLERRALADGDRLVTCSEEDARALAALGVPGAQDKLRVIPNGVDLATFRATALPDAPVVLFPGTLGYAPNVDGALWLCREVWPKVRAAVPEARLVLAGRRPVAEVRELARLPGVEVHPDVPSMADYFERARVVAVPLRIGTGTRLKALEALASGRAVVGTTVGLEGIGVRDGVHARVADDPDALAAAIAECLRDGAAAGALGRAGRAHVEAGFGWPAIGRRFVEVVGELLERSPAAA